MTDHSPHDREAKSRAAQEELKKLGASENVFKGALGSTMKHAGAHFSGRDDPEDDAIEIWGKRIGRTLSLIGVFALGLYLYATYFK
jgi:hypothetical protein